MQIMNSFIGIKGLTNLKEHIKFNHSKQTDYMYDKLSVNLVEIHPTYNFMNQELTISIISKARTFNQKMKDTLKIINLIRKNPYLSLNIEINETNKWAKYFWAETIVKIVLL